MAAYGLLALGIIDTLIGGITGYMESEAISKAQKAQADQIRRNIQQIKDLIQENKIDMKEALKRIDTIINTSKGEIKKIMEEQVDAVVKDMQKSFQDWIRQYRSAMVQRRFEPGSEAYTTAMRKSMKEQAEAVGRTREQALRDISRQMTELGLRGFEMKEAERKSFQQFRNVGLQQIWQLQNMVTALEQQAEVDPFLGFLKGGAVGASEIISSLFFPKGYKQEKLLEKRFTGGK